MKIDGDRQRLAGELADVQKDARTAAVQIGKLEGTVNALQRQIEDQAAIIKAAKPAPVAKPAKTATPTK